MEGQIDEETSIIKAEEVLKIPGVEDVEFPGKQEPSSLRDSPLKNDSQSNRQLFCECLNDDDLLCPRGFQCLSEQQGTPISAQPEQQIKIQTTWAKCYSMIKTR